MQNRHLIEVAKTLFDVDIKIYLQTVSGKWYECKYELNKNDIQLDTVYGITVNGGNTIDFDFKTGKSNDTILKTFVTQFINKWECKQMIVDRV